MSTPKPQAQGLSLSVCLSFLSFFSPKTQDLFFSCRKWCPKGHGAPWKDPEAEDAGGGAALPESPRSLPGLCGSLSPAQDSPEGSSQCRFNDAAGLGWWGCISHKVPGDMEAAGAGATV